MASHPTDMRSLAYQKIITSISSGRPSLLIDIRSLPYFEQHHCILKTILTSRGGGASGGGGRGEEEEEEEQRILRPNTWKSKDSVPSRRGRLKE